MKKTLAILCLSTLAGLGLAQNPDCPLGGQGPCDGTGPGNGAQPCRQDGVPGPQARKRGQCRGQRAGALAMGGPGKPPTSGSVYRDYIKRLNDTLGAELYAQDYYDAAYTALGVKKFKNLSSAETNHASAVANMIVLLGGTPNLTPSQTVTPPTTLAEAEAECISIELMVIDVYKGLIKDAPVLALLRPLTNIQAANYKHLAAVGG